MQASEVARATFEVELARLVASDTLRNSDSLRRLLAYLGDAFIAGTARSLKEYTIGRDVMGKPEDYDPRLDSSVRVQIGKLRQKLEQYYSVEAPEAPFQIHLPRGHFELVLTERPARQEPRKALPAELRLWKLAALALAGLATVLLAASAYWWRQTGQPATAWRSWAPEMREFWGPFLESPRPLVVVLGSPLFIRFHSHYFRNPWVNEWEEAEREIPLKQLSELLKSPTPPSATHRWAPLGEAVAAFRLAAVLSPVRQDLTLKRSTVLAWEDVRSSNLIFLGPPKFNRQLRDLPVEQDFVIEQGAVTNQRPAPGEAALYKKPSPPEAEEIPEDYAVITRVHGAEGWGEVLALASTSTEGTWAAAEYVTRPMHLRRMLERLRSAAGSVPESYQVLVKSRFKTQVPIHTEYVTHHALRLRTPGP